MHCWKEGGMMSKRRRIYCTEPRKIMEASFARKYVNHLVPALAKMSTTSTSSEKEEMVRHQVAMALALSAPQGFAWSDALKQKLQLNPNNIVCSSNLLSAAPSYNAKVNVVENAMLFTNIGSSMANAVAKKSKIRANKRSEEEEEEEEDEIEIRRVLKCVRSVLPGGSEMMVSDDEMLSEVASYISCLELQVKILRSMLQFNCN